MLKKMKMIYKSISLNIKSLYISKFSALRSCKPKMDIDVLVFGSSTIDYITYVNELPQPGKTTVAIHREQCYGGKGANQCVAAAKLGGKCALVSKLGQDSLGEQYVEYLKGMGINVDFVERVEGHSTGLSEISRADNAEKTVILLPGANQMLKSPDVTRAKKLFRHSKVLICQLETDEKAVMFALKHFKGVSILNATPLNGEINWELLRMPTILCVNAEEAALLTNRAEVKTPQDAKAAANDLIGMGVKSVIITMGPLGAVHLCDRQPDFCTQCPAAPVRFLADTSGASDAFVGSLAYHISAYPNLCRESHIMAANICAAYAVGHRGTQPSFPGPAMAHHRLCQIPPEYIEISDEPSPTVESAPPKETTEPAATEPVATEPAATEPVATEPQAETPKAQSRGPSIERQAIST